MTFSEPWPAGIHTSTFQGNPIACAMARATLAEMKANDWVAHARGPIADCFAAKLAPLREHSAIRDVRWVGAAAAIEFADPEGGPDAATRRAVQDACLDRKLLVYGGVGRTTRSCCYRRSISTSKS